MQRKILLLILLSFICSQKSFSIQNLNKENDFKLHFLFTFPEHPINQILISQPQALAINQEGFIYIVDTGNNRVVQFDQNGHYLHSVGGFGWEREQFDRPLDITAKTGLDIFVADYNNERIERYDNKLNYISSFSTSNLITNSLKFGFPSSVDISKHGELFICDNENDRVLKLNSSGEPEISFGDFNWGEGQLENPIKIEVSHSDLVYVTDQGTNQIVVFDYYGNYITRFGNNILSKPNGLSWSEDDRLFVADSGHNRIVVFNQKHKSIFSWGAQGQKLGAFNNPVDVATLNDKIYVLDSKNNRVQVFKISEGKN